MFCDSQYRMHMVNGIEIKSKEVKNLLSQVIWHTSARGGVCP